MYDRATHGVVESIHIINTENQSPNVCEIEIRRSRLRYVSGVIRKVTCYSRDEGFKGLFTKILLTLFCRSCNESFDDITLTRAT